MRLHRNYEYILAYNIVITCSALSFKHHQGRTGSNLSSIEAHHSDTIIERAFVGASQTIETPFKEH